MSLGFASDLTRRSGLDVVMRRTSDVFDPHLSFGDFTLSRRGPELAQEGMEAYTSMKPVTTKPRSGPARSISDAAARANSGKSLLRFILLRIPHYCTFRLKGA